MRNRFRDTVKEVNIGQVMAGVIVQVDDTQIVSVITKDAAKELALKAGDKVIALVDQHQL